MQLSLKIPASNAVFSYLYSWLDCALQRCMLTNTTFLKPSFFSPFLLATSLNISSSVLPFFSTPQQSCNAIRLKKAAGLWHWCLHLVSLSPPCPSLWQKRRRKEIGDWRTRWGNEKYKSWMKRDIYHMANTVGQGLGTGIESEVYWLGDWHGLKLSLLGCNMPSSWYMKGITTYPELVRENLYFFSPWNERCTCHMTVVSWVSLRNFPLTFDTVQVMLPEKT